MTHKMSNRLFQGLIHQMRDTIDATIGVVDETSKINEQLRSAINNIIKNFVINQDDYYGYDSDENQNEYGQAPIIMFIVKTVLINFHGVEEEIEIYIKIKVRREGILPVISFHQAEF